MANTLGETVKCSECAAARNCFVGAMPEAAIQVLSRQQLVGEYPRHTTLFKEGQRPRSVAVLCQGRVKLSVGNGHKEVLRTAGPGEVIGLSAAISGNQHEETAETTSNSRLLLIERNRLLRCLRIHPRAWINVLESLSKDLRAAQGRLWRLSDGRLRPRL
jgi:CRP/FNR family transcriptional regulator